MKFTGESKLFLGIIAITVVIIGLASVVMTKPAPVFKTSDMVPAYAHTKGDPKSNTVLVEFSDFQCPACLTAKPTIDAILKKYPEKLLFVYRNYPLDQHQFSHKAAQAAESAGAQGKYWEMYDLLFANQEKFSDTIFSDLAKQLSLDMTKFDADMKSSTLTDKVNNDVAAGNSFGVNSTPSFFLNGKKVELSSFDDLTKAVDDAVASAK
jgi:protein-disulfide isomerase